MESGRCKGFILQCKLVFNRQPNTYFSDLAKVSYVTGLLKGRILDRAEAVLGDSGSNSMLFVSFVAELKKVFDHPVCTGDVAKRMLNLHQGQRSVADYSVEFRILAAESSWNDSPERNVSARFG